MELYFFYLTAFINYFFFIKTISMLSVLYEGSKLALNLGSPELFIFIYIFRFLLNMAMMTAD